MPRQESRAQPATVSPLTDAFGRGRLKCARGGKVGDLEQAIAIGRRDARASMLNKAALERALRR